MHFGEARVVEVATATASSLGAVRGDRPLALEFWNVRCTRCPAALVKVRALARAGAHAGVGFATCALAVDATGEEAEALAALAELLDGETSSPRALFMDFETKERAKAALGFTTLPFAVLYDAAGEIVWRGDPMADDFVPALTRLTPAPAGRA